MNNQIYIYNGTGITFQLGDGSVMVNATEMAKPFGKNVGHWLENNQTNEFLNILSRNRNSDIDDLIKVVKGGSRPQGTWMHEDVAMEFARWLSPAFAIWCNDHIKRLLIQGYTSLSDDEIVYKGYQILGRKVRMLEKENETLRPKAALMDKVIDMGENIDIGQVAKILELSYGRNILFKKLRASGVLFKNCNEPKQQYVEAGYFKLKEHIIPRDNHPDKLVIKVLVTQKGLDWLAQKLGVIKSNKQLALIL